MLQLICLDLDKIFKQLEREEKSEKNKKNERGRMFTVALVYGGGGA